MFTRVRRYRLRSQPSNEQSQLALQQLLRLNAMRFAAMLRRTWLRCVPDSNNLEYPSDWHDVAEARRSQRTRAQWSAKEREAAIKTFRREREAARIARLSIKRAPVPKPCFIRGILSRRQRRLRAAARAAADKLKAASTSTQHQPKASGVTSVPALGAQQPLLTVAFEVRFCV